jgi:hypothetical protein
LGAAEPSIFPPTKASLQKKKEKRLAKKSLLLTPHSFSVTLFTLGFRLFFIQLQINQKQKN